MAQPDEPRFSVDVITRSNRELEETLLKNRRHKWIGRHLDAWRAPQGFELPLWHLIRGLAQYGALTEAIFGSKLGADAMLGPAAKDTAEAILTLLSGSTGRFDAGTLDKLVRAICAEYGIELEP